MFLESNHLGPVGKARPICGINMHDRRYYVNHFMLNSKIYNFAWQKIMWNHLTFLQLIFLLPSLFCSLVYHKVTAEMSERVGTFCCWPCFGDPVELSCSLFILSNRSLVSFMSFVFLLLTGNGVAPHLGEKMFHAVFLPFFMKEIFICIYVKT